MGGWMELCEVTKKKLDRELQQKEIEFIKWMYEKHIKEKECKLKSE